MAAEAAQPARSHGRGRRIAVVVLLVLAPIVFFVGALATWVDRVALENSTWSDVTQKIATDPAVTTPLADALSQKLQAQADFQTRLSAALPPQLQPLAAPAAGALNELVDRASTRIVTSPRGISLLVAASTVAHAQAIKIIDGDTKLGDVTNGITIDVSSVLSELSQRLGLPDVASRLPAANKTIVIVPKRNLSAIKQVIDVIRALSTWLIFVGLALLAAAVYLAGDRRRAVFWAAVGLVTVGLLLAIARIVGGGIVPDAVASTDSGKQAASAIYNIVSEGLRDIAITIAAVGVVGIAGSWLVGPGRRATGLRRIVAPWIENPWYAFGGLAAVLLLIIAWGPTRGARTPVTIVICTVLAVVGLEVLRRQSAMETAAAPAGSSGPGLLAGARGMLSKGGGGQSAELERLAGLHDRGALTDEEFAAAKRELLNGGDSTP
jgi:hypothetical protein